MLVSVLRNIGLSTVGEKDEIDIIIEEQSKRLAHSENIFVCDVDLTNNSFNIYIEELDVEKIDKYLPGITTGHSRNFSPFFALKYQISQKEKDFRKLKPSQLINLKKMPDINAFLEKVDNTLPLSFLRWLEANEKSFFSTLHSIVEREFTEEKEDGKVIVTKNAPKFIVFRINGYFPGEISSFREIFLFQKNYQTKKSTKKVEEEVVCIACGEKKDDLLSLEKCKFFKFFSIDQFYFQLGFNKNAKQAMICKDCEILVRQGYSELDTTLKFEAYRLKIKEKEYRYIKHSILPLSSDVKTIQQFVQKLHSYRRKVYESKKETIRSKIEELQTTLEKIDKKKKVELKKELRKELKTWEKKYKEIENSGEIKGSSDIGLKDLLIQASENKVGIIDFYYEDVAVAGNKKKLVEDLIYGDRNQVERIVQLLKETDKLYENQITFEFGYLFDVFGEKVSRLIIQSLFNGKKIDRKILYKAAYEHIWQIFRETLVKKDNETYGFKKYQVNRGKEIFHYTLSLLEKGNVLR